ncbi:unnamed protein product [Bursaphelenchus xylophilus]|uniref:(pine wood nematode) hypothetical protein n=1 Tax=Bursaphelenchus xylophilus TaxID=6326 RepID=A0A811KFH4_BURXY|nr:unnamed protein product [Bursaphelenchus xylophilus]CAG9094501.1 unnamed protein product [Bursaphelenchus xylophilus]
MESTVKNKKLPLPYIRYIIDAIIVLGISLGTDFLGRLIGPSEIGFYCNDRSIRYKYQEERLGNGFLAFYSLIPNFILVFIVETYRILRIDGIEEFSKYEVGRSKAQRIFVRVATIYGYHTASIAAVGFICNTVKYPLGILRPHFLDICRPNIGYDHCNTTELITDYHCTSGLTGQIREARLSFFSAHACLCIGSATFAVIYLQDRLYGCLYSDVILLLIQSAYFCSSLAVACTRILDHYHHPYDVIVGALVGIVVVTICKPPKMSVDFKAAYAALVQGLQNQTRLPSYMQSDDDFDDACSLQVGWSREQSCNYVTTHYDNCEGGGYLPWTQIIYCQPTELTEVLLLLVSIFWLLQLFILLAVSADEFLSTNITTIADKFGISQSVAGVTLVAFGNGAPDIFSAIASAVSDESPKAGLAIGQLLGGGMFITTIVVPVVIFIAPIQMDPIPTLRNLGFYVVALLWLGMILFLRNTLMIWQSVGFLFIYIVYALTVVSGRMLLRLQKWREAKDAMFVRPSTGHPNRRESHPNTISGTLANLERSNTIKPAASSESSMYSRAEDDALPCQDVSLQGIALDFFNRLNCINVEEFKNASIYLKIFQIFQFPWMILLTLSTPLAQPPWCKALTSLHVVVSPLFLLFAFQLFDSDIFGIQFPLWAMSLILSGILLAFVLLFTKVNQEPKYYKLIACCCGFVVSVGWVYVVAAEVVSAVQMLGVLSHLSPEILGVTILGWTNSIGDLVADSSLARQGYSHMALAAAFGGPLFNLLIGFGLSFTIALLQGKTVEIDVDIEKIFMYGFMCISVVGSLTILVLSRFRTHKFYAMLLFCVYFLFMVALILAETVFRGS